LEPKPVLCNREFVEMSAERLTFALLDRARRIAEPGPASGEEYPLEAWYRSVRDLPLDELTTEDLSRALRQNIHLDHIVPLALKILGAEPLAGEMYDGELLVSLKAVPPRYWSRHEDERRSLRSSIEAALRMEEATEDVRTDARELLKLAAERR
jgi:hypothetical protein